MPLGSPGVTVGVVGGGQLGRMLGEAAAPLGVEIVVADPTPDCPASPVVRDQIVGGFDDPDTLWALAERADLLTFEIELADQDLLAEIEEETGTPVHPSPATLAMIEDKLGQKRSLAKAGIPVPGFREVSSADELHKALDELGVPAMLKARRGGYDGRGNIALRSRDQVEEAMEAIAGPAMVEGFVPYDRELSVIGCVGVDERDLFPVTETIHEEEILRATVTPARTGEPILERARQVAHDVLDVLEGRGVYGIELFEVDGEILVNEIAPRPHNSGHWTIEGAVTSQFEQHVRAVTGQPLGATDLIAPTVSFNILGDVDATQRAELHGAEEVLSTDRAALHWYGKREVRPLRKMGHVTLLGRPGGDTDGLLAAATGLRDRLTFQAGR